MPNLSTMYVNNIAARDAVAVTFPNKIAFLARAGIVRNAWANAVIPYVDVAYNYGSCYNPNTSAFTAPISGLYHFSGQQYKTNNTTNCRFRINGAYTFEPVRQLGAYPTEHSSCTWSLSVYLNVNDVVDLSIDNGDLHLNASYSYFSGYLIG
jgi:hypothetical protein